MRLDQGLRSEVTEVARTQQDEVKRRNSELIRATQERDVLKEVVRCFARESM